MRLIVAEKPSVGRTIAEVVGAKDRNDGYLSGGGYIVSWCLGHIVELANPNEYDEKYTKWTFETLPIIPETWQFRVIDNDGVRKQFGTLKKLMLSNSVDEIICATDADREGECIFRYVYNLAGCRKPVKRLWISSLESSAIQTGLDNIKPSSEYDNLFNAGFDRAKADWLVGMNFSRIFSLKYNAWGQNSLKVGRVKTPTLNMIVEREDKIKNFVKEKSFTVDITCHNENGEFKAVSEETFKDEQAAQNVNSECNGQTAHTDDVKKENKQIGTPKLYDLTSLQREANKKFGYTAKQTLEYVQSLYEAKLCTYPRTDSQYIPDDMAENAIAVLNVIPEKFDFVSENELVKDIKKVCNTEKAADHPALIPQIKLKDTDLASLPEGERNILTLMALRLVTATSNPFKFEQVKAVLSVGSHKFTATGKTTVDEGFKSIEKRYKNTDNSDKDISLPPVADSYDNIKSEISTHYTSPPKSFTEDTLLSAMEHAGQENYDENSEKKGLGTPATRAGIIDELVKNGYIEREKRKILPTEKGIKLIKVMPDSIKSPKLTVEWETKLQQIEKGNYSADGFMNEIKEYVEKICNENKAVDSNVSFGNTENSSIGKCPKCGQDLTKSKYGGYYCVGKCGMNVSKVFGKVLTDSQIKKLLSGEKISYNSGKFKTTVLPEIDEREYNGKTYFNWKTDSEFIKKSK